VPISGSWRSQREALATLAWSTAPATTPGQDLYSNVGYVVAADIMEHDANDTYEKLLVEYLWKPLGMGCVFNYPSVVWGHYGQHGTLPGGIPTYTIIPSQADNGPYYGPAARAQCSLEDYGKFLREHLRGPGDKSALLPDEYYQAMHDDPGDALGNYQAGWIIGDYKGDVRLTHDGSNRLNYVTTTVVPGRNVAVVVVANMAEDLFGAIPGQVATVREELLARYRP
jgi:CubicO group peptidase (beta-lactamase class C family)